MPQHSKVFKGLGGTESICVTKIKTRKPPAPTAIQCGLSWTSSSACVQPRLTLATSPSGIVFLLFYRFEKDHLIIEDYQKSYPDIPDTTIRVVWTCKRAS